MLGLFS